MRLYTFINFYLSQIQQGIQTAHIVHELFNAYDTVTNNYTVTNKDGPGKMLDDWSRDHKTIIVLSAGVDQNIQELMDVFTKYEFPFTQFVEDEGLCKARTGCGIVLPEWIYGCERKYEVSGEGRFKVPYYEYFKELDAENFEQKQFRPGDKYYDLIDLIKSKRLA